MKYGTFASGYLVQDDKVLLVHHNKLDKWVPPGGHLEEDELPADAAVREFKEETGIAVEVIPAYPSAFAGDSNSTPIPLPFHMDVEIEGFDIPQIGHFFYVKAVDGVEAMQHQESELFAIDWFSKDDLQSLQTFDQVRSVAAFALDNYPKE